MSPYRSIELAIDLAERRRDEAESRLTQVLQMQVQADGQLRQLLEYGAETEARLIQKDRGTVSVEVLRHHHQFMVRLQEAIRMQENVMKGMESRVAFARTELAKKESAVMGLRKILARRMQDQLRKEERRSQNAMDELAVQQYLRRAQVELEGVQ